MRLGAWFLAGAAALLAGSGCSGDYPLAPTTCDEWCHVTKGETCPEYYNPSSCVSECEMYRDLETCPQELAAELACFRRDPNAAQARCGAYFDDSDLPCGFEQYALAACLSPAPPDPTFP